MMNFCELMDELKKEPERRSLNGNFASEFMGSAVKSPLMKIAHELDRSDGHNMDVKISNRGMLMLPMAIEYRTGPIASKEHWEKHRIKHMARFSDDLKGNASQFLRQTAAAFLEIADGMDASMGVFK